MSLANLLRFSRPDTDVLEPTHAELVIRVRVLADEVSRLSRQLAELKAQAHTGTVRVERSGCTLIADRLGINERTVRKVLVESPHFARVREATVGTPITRNAAFLAWLADNLETAWPR